MCVWRVVSRPDVPIFNGFSLKVAPKTTVALVGASGSGKSTIIQLLQRFYDVEGGDILVDGQKLADMNIKSLRNRIGIVSQEPVLFSGTIADNVRYGLPNASDDDVIAA